MAHTLEALSLVAERDSVSARWQRPGYKPLKHARRCYSHVAGELGVAQFDMMVRCGHLQAGEQGLRLSESGRAWTARLGLVFPDKPEGRFAYPCMDWSERRDHLAGSLAKALLEHYLAKHRLTADRASRALNLTSKGQRELLPLLQAA